MLNLGTETLLIISPHGSSNHAKALMNVNPSTIINFEEFGDFSSKTKTKTDLILAEKIRYSILEPGRLEVINKKTVDFGCGVPTFILSGEFKNLKTLYLNSSPISSRDNFEIGLLIGREVAEYEKIVSVIGSCDLSHRLNKKSPGGYSPKGQKLDLKLTNLVYEKRIEDLLDLDEKTIREAGVCGIGAIAMLFGIMTGAGMDWEMSSSTYESPFGVGFLTASLNLREKDPSTADIV